MVEFTTHSEYESFDAREQMLNSDLESLDRLNHKASHFELKSNVEAQSEVSK